LLQSEVAAQAEVPPGEEVGGAVHEEEVPVDFVVVIVHLVEDAELLEGLPEEEGVPVAEAHLEVGAEGDSHRIEIRRMNIIFFLLWMKRDR
jgi:hypothetical protein